MRGVLRAPPSRARRREALQAKRAKAEESPLGQGEVDAKEGKGAYSLMKVLVEDHSVPIVTRPKRRRTRTSPKRARSLKSEGEC